MEWAYIALAARILLLGYEKIAVKQVGSGSDGDAATFVYFFSSTLFIIPFLAFAKLPAEWGFMKFLTASSVVYTAAFLLYVKSISIGEVSLVSPLYNFSGFFLLILTWLFLGEPVTLMKAAGIGLLLYGASFLNRRQSLSASFRALFSDRACLMMIVCSFLIAIGRTIDGFVIKSVDPIVYAFGIYAEMTLFLFLIVLANHNVRSAIQLFSARRNIVLVAGAVNSLTYLLLLYAITRIAVSVVEPASMLGMVVTVVLSYVILGEKIAERLVGVIVMIAGAWLLFI